MRLVSNRHIEEIIDILETLADMVDDKGNLRLINKKRRARLIAKKLRNSKVADAAARAAR